FDRLGVPSVPKTTGKRGLHILVPLAAGHTYEDAESFALSVGETVAKQLDTVTLDRSPSARGGCTSTACRTGTGRPSSRLTPCAAWMARPSRRRFAGARWMPRSIRGSSTCG